MAFEDTVVGCSANELSIVYAYALYSSFKADFSVRYTDNLLMEHAFDAIACDIKLRTEFVAATEW